MHVILLFFLSKHKSDNTDKSFFFKVYCSITLSRLLDISEYDTFVLFPLQRHIYFLPVGRANSMTRLCCFPYNVTLFSCR